MNKPWSSSNRKSRLPKNWNNLRLKVLSRDSRVCQLKYHGCLIKATEVDHIKPGDDHSLGNLQAVCAWCHGIKSSKEGNYAPNRMRVRKKRPTENHPGLRKSGL